MKRAPAIRITDPEIRAIALMHKALNPRYGLRVDLIRKLGGTV